MYDDADDIGDDDCDDDVDDDCDDDGCGHAAGKGTDGVNEKD